MQRRFVVFPIMIASDTCVPSHTELAHLCHVVHTINLCTNANLTLNVKKSAYAYKSIRMLGHLVSDCQDNQDRTKTDQDRPRQNQDRQDSSEEARCCYTHSNKKRSQCFPFLETYIFIIFFTEFLEIFFFF
eukprot:Pompholyxophrys_punicea_v1_NODE_19_length_5902_cov_21.503677.p5 type:complete len:131 gc:universal NODE_19_length_5902_cov_21.503677:5568-5176(-)